MYQPGVTCHREEDECENVLWLLCVHSHLEESPPRAKGAGGSSGAQISSVTQDQDSSSKSVILVSVLSMNIYSHVYFTVTLFSNRNMVNFTFTEENSNHRLAGTFAESFLRCAELCTTWFIRRECSYNNKVERGYLLPSHVE